MSNQSTAAQGLEKPTSVDKLLEETCKTVTQQYDTLERENKRLKKDIEIVNSHRAVLQADLAKRWRSFMEEKEKRIKAENEAKLDTQTQAELEKERAEKLKERERAVEQSQKAEPKGRERKRQRNGHAMLKRSFTKQPIRDLRLRSIEWLEPFSLALKEPGEGQPDDAEDYANYDRLRALSAFFFIFEFPEHTLLDTGADVPLGYASFWQAFVSFCELAAERGITAETWWEMTGCSSPSEPESLQTRLQNRSMCGKRKRCNDSEECAARQRAAKKKSGKSPSDEENPWKFDSALDATRKYFWKFESEHKQLKRELADLKRESDHQKEVIRQHNDERAARLRAEEQVEKERENAEAEKKRATDAAKLLDDILGAMQATFTHGRMVQRSPEVKQEPSD
ncbi:hypothetical protein M011DRAFT_481832 [Sporormia fimetaria CBS 119925]|uniref:Uncharacterized protein n=1 Tax=Sporormia fimetaria CBS 119925 TaxID=1340428 RepID=A0A6A6UXI1_9PLEO|nr:hypothetical protein M011DRAFT_481832 [Sporormia fimetaria CBS 119925]